MMLEMVAAATILLWPDGEMPCRRQTGEWSATTRKDGVVTERNVSAPSLEFFPAAGEGARPCVIVCPGGGYTFLAVNKEGSEIAAWLNGIGYSAFVLRYRVPDNPDGAFADAVRALEVVRGRAAEFRVDPRRVGMMGFSAGANLTARASTWGPRPDFALVIYPWWIVPDPSAGKSHPGGLRGLFGVNAMTPPTFVVQSADDCYGVENAQVWAEALRKAKVPCELHVFADGGHGYGIRKRGKSSDGWEKLAEKWLKRLNPARDITRLRFNNPAAQPYLKVGLWAWPMAMDYDGDGDLDLVVACGDTPYGGTHFFENAGGGAMPVFRKGIRVAEGRGNVARGTSAGDGRGDVCVPGATVPDFVKSGYGAAARLGDLPANVHSNTVRGNVWRLVDFDGDGVRDVVVGVGDWTRYGAIWQGKQENYAKDGTWLTPPVDGLVYWCRGNGAGYGKPEPVRLADGRPLWVNGNPMPMCEDWDGDGDLDILCGEFVDGFTYFENVGTRTAPRYAAGRRLKADGGGDLQMELAMITPSAVDWDGDGKLDLICGDEDGRVAFIRNTGRMADGAPVFAPPRYFRQEADALGFGVLSTPCGVDWDGDGDWDLICGDSAGHIAFIENLSGPGVAEPKWAEPVRLKAGGEEIRIMAGEKGSIQGPIERKWGYTCLTAADWDGDGLPDIMANSIWGDVVWFRNVGTRAKPELAAAEDVEVEWDGPQPEMPFGWYQPRHKRNPKGLLTQWRTTPVMFDWDGDGLTDLVMLDKEGYLALYRRERRGGRLVLLPPRRVFADAQGQPLRPAARMHGASGRRKLAITDWDGDGRPDLVMNSRNAEVWLNQGAADGLTRFRRVGDVAEYRLAGHTSAPTAVDFDGDGVMDLVIGAEDGFFYHVRNPRGAGR